MVAYNLFFFFHDDAVGPENTGGLPPAESICQNCFKSTGLYQEKSLDLPPNVTANNGHPNWTDMDLPANLL
jgi:hypothetical protein